MTFNLFRSSAAADSSLRELQAAREIAHAFLVSDEPAEVYRVALQRVVPLVGAAFACVFLRQPDDPALLYVVAAHNWPEVYAPYLESMRVRVGNGPTGHAVARAEMVEVPNVFADTGLEAWWEPARELGFSSSISLPLMFDREPAGAVTFYFSKPEAIEATDRSLLRLVADQLAATAEKAHLIEDLRDANKRLREQNVDLEARYREAEEARRLKNEFLANVSHELRTPLTAVLGYAYLLKEGHPGPLTNDQTDALGKIETAGNALLALITDLLDLTQLKLGRTTVEPELCDAVALARAAVPARPPQEGVELRTQAPDDKVPLHTDPTLVLRILEKLVANAIKFTTQGTVTIRVRVEPERTVNRGDARAAHRAPMVVWEIADTGIGISPEDQAIIFDEFRQVDGSATRRFGGTGLGLALARGLARRLGGDLTVESVPNEGSTFRLMVPSSVAYAASFETSEPSTPIDGP